MTVTYLHNINLPNCIAFDANDINFVFCCPSQQNGWSPLLVASEEGHEENLRILLQQNARVDVFDEVRILREIAVLQKYYYLPVSLTMT